MSAPDTITEVTYHRRPANEFEVNAFLRAIGFEGGAKHLTDVLAGRRPSALAEPSIWRSKPEPPAPTRALIPGMRVRCWNVTRSCHDFGVLLGFGRDGLALVEREVDGNTCRFKRVHVVPVDGGAR